MPAKYHEMSASELAAATIAVLHRAAVELRKATGGPEWEAANEVDYLVHELTMRSTPSGVYRSANDDYYRLSSHETGRTITGTHERVIHDVHVKLVRENGGMFLYLTPSGNPLFMADSDTIKIGASTVHHLSFFARHPTFYAEKLAEVPPSRGVEPVIKTEYTRTVKEVAKALLLPSVPPMVAKPWQMIDLNTDEKSDLPYKSVLWAMKLYEVNPDHEVECLQKAYDTQTAITVAGAGTMAGELLFVPPDKDVTTIEPQTNKKVRKESPPDETKFVCQQCHKTYLFRGVHESVDLPEAFCSIACRVKWYDKNPRPPYVTAEIPVGEPETCTLGTISLEEVDKTLSKLIRPAFKPPASKHLIEMDFAVIQPFQVWSHEANRHYTTPPRPQNGPDNATGES